MRKKKGCATGMEYTDGQTDIQGGSWADQSILGYLAML
jgi:hypothetical protein